MISSNAGNTSMQLAEMIVDSGVYKVYWNRPFEEWPVSEQGRICPAYCNLRTLVGDVSMRNTIGTELADLVQKQKAGGAAIDIICGIVSAGVPWATIISEKLNMPMCYSRPNIKPYGEKHGVEGVLHQDMGVVMIDDVLLTGSTMAKTSVQLRGAGLSVASICTIARLSDEVPIIDPTNTNSDAAEGMINTLLTYEDLIKVSLDRKLMSEDQSNRLRYYYQHPETQPWY